MPRGMQIERHTIDAAGVRCDLIYADRLTVCRDFAGSGYGRRLALSETCDA
jgi:hypothetical protein